MSKEELIDRIERRMLKGWRTVKFEGAELDVILSALRASPAPVDGWRLVPVEPTEEMYAAANREWDGRMSARSCGVWQAMLAAAPSPPSSSSPRSAGEGISQHEGE